MTDPKVTITESEMMGAGFCLKFSDGEWLRTRAVFKDGDESVVLLPSDFGFTPSYLRALADWLEVRS